MGVHLINMFLFPPLCVAEVSANRQTDRRSDREIQTDNTSHKGKQMESDVNTQTAALMLILADIYISFYSNSEFNSRFHRFL